LRKRVRVRHPRDRRDEAAGVASLLQKPGVRVEMVEDDEVDVLVIEGPDFETTDVDSALEYLDEGNTRRTSPQPRRQMDDRGVQEWQWDW